MNIRQATVQETDIIIDVLGEAAHWLEERGIPLWDEDELKQVGPYFVSRYELDVGRGQS